MKVLVGSILCYLAHFSAILAIHGECCQPDYYWRDYVNGKIPEDALVATDDGKSKTYVGNVPMGLDSVLLGQIHSGLDDISVTYVINKLFHKNKFIKILCSNHPENFAWVEGNEKANITDHLVVGGNLERLPLYIGRVQCGGLRLGTVYHSPETQMDYFLTPRAGKVLKFARDYEILTYRCECANMVDAQSSK